MSTSTIRPSFPEAAKTDAETICHHRRAMFRDMGHPDDAVMDAMVTAFRPWVEQRLESSEYRATQGRISSMFIPNRPIVGGVWPAS